MQLARSTGCTWVVALAGSALASCTPGADTQPEPATTQQDSAGIRIVESDRPLSPPWRLSSGPIVEIGDGLPVELTPLDPTAVFPGVDGRILVGDGNQVGWDAVLVYDSLGRFLERIGGAGRGPGEFGGQLWGAGPYRGDSIVAWDRLGPSGPSVKVFGADGGYSRDVPIPQIPREGPPGTTGFSDGFHGVFSDGSLLVSSRGILELPSDPGPTWYVHALLAVRPDGAAWDTIGEYPLAPSFWDGRTQSRLYLYGAAGLVVPYGDDLIWAPGSPYEYRIINRAGTVRLVVRRSYEPVPVNPSDIEAVVDVFLEAAPPEAPEEQLEELRRTIESEPRAPIKPAYSAILVDDARNVWSSDFAG